MMKSAFEYIAQQFSKPNGWGGKVSTKIMNCLNQKQYQSVFDYLDLKLTDTVLDIGFGNGYLIQKLTKEPIKKIIGIEISPDMIDRASKNNQEAIQQGKVVLISANVQQLPFEDNSIDKIYTVNTFYFWENVPLCLQEIQRVLKSDGLFLNVLYSKEWLNKLPITKYGFKKYSREEIQDLFEESDMIVEEIFDIENKKSFCILARKKTEF